MKVSAIIPAYNEGPRIETVLQVLTHSPVSEIIVVDDGSLDNTSRIAELYARVIRHPVRKGKGEALDTGVRASNEDVLFFCDADIQGLTSEIVVDIIAPVLQGSVDMHIGARASKARHLGSWVYNPLLDGQRALTKSLWYSVPKRFRGGFGVETALNHVAVRSPKGLHFKHYDISQIRKEEKRGYVRGRWGRFVMYNEIALMKARLVLGVF